MKYILEIKPAITPRTRHQLQDVLKANGFDIHGGGTDTDMSSCEISFSRDDPRDKE